MRRWTVYPAIDLRRGRVVRLMQGDPGRSTEYARDPLTVIPPWHESGAEWLHVVNLDGAFGGASPENQIALERILRAGLHVQFGGGLRTFDSLSRALDLGVSRVVIGSAAVEDPALIDRALGAFGPERIGVAIDALEDKVRIHGWRRETAVAVTELVQQCVDQGVRWVIVTDVSRDGTSSGLNLAMALLAQEMGLHVIASGGVSGLEDVEQAYRAGLDGVIIGRALYEHRVNLRDALEMGRISDAV